MFLRKTNFFLYSIGVLLLICKLATAAPREFPKYQINDPEAICNDGTPAVYYFRPSKFGGPQATWHVQLQGGFWCHDKASCEERKTRWSDMITSSKSPPNQNNLDGIFSTNQTQNPLLWDANQIFVWYCSSDVWSGTQYNKEIGFAFHGKKIIKGLINTLFERHQFGEATNFVFSGCSAGAKGALANSDYVFDLVNSRNPKITYSQYHVFLDSGFAFDYPVLESFVPSHREQFSKGINLWRGIPNENCIKEYQRRGNESEIYKCYMAEYSLEYVNSNIFMHMAVFDGWQVYWNLGQYHNPNIRLDLKNNQTQIQYVRKFGDYSWKTIVGIEKLRKPGSYFYFSESCVMHCGSSADFYFNAKIEGKSFGQTVDSFIKNEKPKSLIDGCGAFDCTQGCGKLQSKSSTCGRQ